VNSRKKLLLNERGATALEFAILAPVFFLLIFGIIEFGVLFWTQVGLQHGVEMAARCASLPTTSQSWRCPSIETYAAQNAFGLSLPPTVFLYTVIPCGNNVSASYPFVFTGLNLGPLTLTAQACSPA
jgi:Flp pilus assembly protein TadG